MTPEPCASLREHGAQPHEDARALTAHTRVEVATDSWSSGHPALVPAG